MSHLGRLDHWPAPCSKSMARMIPAGWVQLNCRWIISGDGHFQSNISIDLKFQLIRIAKFTILLDENAAFYSIWIPILMIWILAALFEFSEHLSVLHDWLSSTISLCHAILGLGDGSTVAQIFNLNDQNCPDRARGCIKYPGYHLLYSTATEPGSNPGRRTKSSASWWRYSVSSSGKWGGLRQSGSLA